MNKEIDDVKLLNAVFHNEIFIVADWIKFFSLNAKDLLNWVQGVIKLLQVKLVNPNNPNFHVAMTNHSLLVCNVEQAVKTMSVLMEIQLYCLEQQNPEYRFLFVQHCLYKLVDQLHSIKVIEKTGNSASSRRFKKPMANHSTNCIYPLINEKSIVNQFVDSNFDHVDIKTIDINEIIKDTFFTLEDFDIYGTRKISIDNVYHVFFHIVNNYDKLTYLNAKAKMQAPIQINTFSDKLAFVLRSRILVASHDAIIFVFKDIIEVAAFQYILDDNFTKALNNFFGAEYFYYGMSKLESIAYSHIWKQKGQNTIQLPDLKELKANLELSDYSVPISYFQNGVIDSFITTNSWNISICLLQFDIFCFYSWCYLAFLR